MLNLTYNVVIEATEDPNFFCFYSPDLEGFSGLGHSIEDCIYKARHGTTEHIAIVQELGKPVPAQPESATILIRDAQTVTK